MIFIKEMEKCLQKLRKWTQTSEHSPRHSFHVRNKTNMSIVRMYKVLLAFLLFEISNVAVSLKNDINPSEVLKDSKIKPLSLPRKNLSQLDLGPLLNGETNRNELQKKSPKTTIQKIIKKHQMKSKKYYLKKVSSPIIKATVIPMNKINENSKPSTLSTMPPQRKKSRKIYNNIVRNPQPFNKIHFQRRSRRNINGDNMYILQDLDELKFLGNNSDYDTIDTQVKNFW